MMELSEAERIAAAAEKKHAEARQLAERERDESTHALKNCWDHKVRVLKELDEMRTERDEARSLAGERFNAIGPLQFSLDATRAERDAALANYNRALAKAETAEKSCDEWAKTAADEQLRRGELRTRIEALAGERWDLSRFGPKPSSMPFDPGTDLFKSILYIAYEQAKQIAAIRDLLYPPKPETPLDLLLRAEKAYDCDGYTLAAADFVELRKMLENVPRG